MNDLSFIKTIRDVNKLYGKSLPGMDERYVR